MCNVYTLHCVMSCVSIIELIYFRLEKVCLFSSARVSPPPLADDVSEDNAELRRNLPPSPGAATCSASTIPRPQLCTVNFQSAARVQRIPGTMLLSAQPISPASSGPGQWQHPHNVTQWPVSCVPVLPLCLLCNLAAGQDQDGVPELGTQHRHRAPVGTQLGSQHSSSGSWDDHIEWVSNILAWLLVPFGND